MVRAVKLVLRVILCVPLWCLGYILFGALYLEGWLIEVIWDDK